MKSAPSSKTATVRSSFASTAGGYVSTGRTMGSTKGPSAAPRDRHGAGRR